MSFGHAHTQELDLSGVHEFAMAQQEVSFDQPELIHEYSSGPIQTSETIDYETGGFVSGGPVCPQLFGTDGQQFAHIDLASPVVHPWTYRSIHGQRSCLAEALFLSQDDLLALVGSELSLRDDGTLVEKEEGGASFSFGADSVRQLARRAGSAWAEGCVLQTIAVLPYCYRPTRIRKADGSVLFNDLTDRYSSIQRRCERQARLRDMKASSDTLRTEARILQRAIDRLFLGDESDGKASDISLRNVVYISASPDVDLGAFQPKVPFAVVLKALCWSAASQELLAEVFA